MNAKAIVVTSGKGGVGKTTTTANVGAALAKLGEKVVVIDTDVGLRNLDVVMGLEGRVVYDLIDVFEGRCKLKQALIRDKRVENLHLLAASQTRDKSALSEARMKETVTALIDEEGFDRILIDSPAGIESGFQTAASAAEGALVVVNPEVSSVRDADRIIGLLEARGITEVRCIINRLRPDMVKRGDMLEVDDVLEILGIKLIGIVPEDEKIIISTNVGSPISLGGRKRPMKTRDCSAMTLRPQVVQIAATMVGAAAMPAIATSTQSACRKSRIPKSQDRNTPISASVPITMPKGPVIASTMPCSSVCTGERSMLCASAGPASTTKAITMRAVTEGDFINSFLSAAHRRPAHGPHGPGSQHKGGCRRGG